MIVAERVSKRPVLPETTARFRHGAVTPVIVERGQLPTVLGLILAGRMTPDSGGVAVDGVDDRQSLRLRSALVDAPGASEPYDVLPLIDVMHEELRYAGVRHARRTARELLAAWGARRYGGTRLSDVPAELRIRALCELAAMRPGVDVLVVVSPDRHGGDPGRWREPLDALAARGLAIAVLVGAAAAAVLRDEAAPDEQATAVPPVRGSDEAGDEGAGPSASAGDEGAVDEEAADEDAASLGGAHAEGRTADEAPSEPAGAGAPRVDGADGGRPEETASDASPPVAADGVNGGADEESRGIAPAEGERDGERPGPETEGES